MPRDCSSRSPGATLCAVVVLATLSLSAIIFNGCADARHHSVSGESVFMTQKVVPLDSATRVYIDELPKLIHYEKPKYPRVLEMAGVEGVVWVKALVNTKGLVADAAIHYSSGAALFDEEALRATRLNKFKPGVKDGKPVAVWVVYRVQFVLR